MTLSLEQTGNQGAPCRQTPLFREMTGYLDKPVKS